MILSYKKDWNKLANELSVIFSDKVIDKLKENFDSNKIVSVKLFLKNIIVKYYDRVYFDAIEKTNWRRKKYGTNEIAIDIFDCVNISVLLHFSENDCCLEKLKRIASIIDKRNRAKIECINKIVNNEYILAYKDCSEILLIVTGKTNKNEIVLKSVIKDTLDSYQLFALKKYKFKRPKDAIDFAIRNENIENIVIRTIVNTHFSYYGVIDVVTIVSKVFYKLKKWSIKELIKATKLFCYIANESNPDSIEDRIVDILLENNAIDDINSIETLLTLYKLKEGI